MASRQWCFTIFNYQEDVVPIDEELCKYLIIGKETCPTTEKKHLQCFAWFKKPVSQRQLKMVHPTAHWQKANGDAWQNKVYCSKGEQSKEEFDEMKEEGPNYGLNADVYEYGAIPQKPKKKQSKADDNLVYDAVLDAPSVRAGMDILKSKRSRDYCLYGEQIERNVKRHKVVPTTGLYNIDDFLKSALSLDKPTLLCGSSNTGKTQFALAHFVNPLMVSHPDRLKLLSPDHDGIVFDDMSFKHWPVEAVIHLLDSECDREIHIRYGTVTIPAGTKKIFTHNTSNPFYNPETTDVEQIAAIERRYETVNILNKLY